jgi:hypothetical protein
VTVSEQDENRISVLGRELLLVDVGGGVETHLAREADGPGRSSVLPDHAADVEPGPWEPSTVCGRTWHRMAAGADDLLPLWADPAFAPTCRGCLRVLDSWFPSADAPQGIHLLAAVVAEDVTRFSSTYVTGIPAEHVEATRRAIRKALRAEGFRSNTMALDGIVHVWSDDAFQQIDQSGMKDRVAGALQKVTLGPDAPDALDDVSGPGPIDWHTWVIDG